MFSYELFGKSHDRYIGLSAHNLPLGYKIDLNHINDCLALRRSSYKFNTTRNELDEILFLEGVENNVVVSSPVTFIIENGDVRKQDYSKIFRPSHGDHISYMMDGVIHSGGGRFSGRLTVLITVLGAIIEDNSKFCDIYYHISEMLDYCDDDIREINFDELTLIDTDFPVINHNIKNKMLNKLNEIVKDGDSVGAKLTFRLENISPLIGGFFQDSFESILSKNLFAIGGIKGIEFGMGQDYTKKLGSNCNDEYYLADDKIKSKKNLQGGINAGFTNGYEPVIFSVVVRPTPTIFKPMKTVGVDNGEFVEVLHKPDGRHDSFIANRVAIAIKMMVFISIFEMEMNEQNNRVKRY